MINDFFNNSSTRSSGHHQSFFFNFRFSSRKSQSQQKLAKKMTYFTTKFRSKNLTHFTNLNSLDIEKICSRNTAKNLSQFQNQRFCPNTGKYRYDSANIRENTDTILPTYGKIRIRESPYFSILHAVREQELDTN